MRGRTVAWKALTSTQLQPGVLAPHLSLFSRPTSVWEFCHPANARRLPLRPPNRKASSWSEADIDGRDVQSYESTDGIETNSDRRPRDNTLTEAERAIFQQIYQDAADKSAQHALTDEGRIERLIGETGEDSSGEEPLSTFFDRARDALRLNHESPGRARSPLEADRTPEADPKRPPPELLQDIPNFRVQNILRRPGLPKQIPSTIRKSLMVALDQPVQSLPATQGKTESVTDKDQPQSVDLSPKKAKIIKASSQDAYRVDRMLQEADTDHKIWRILQREVFAPVELFLHAMKAESDRAKGDSSKKRRGRRAKQVSSEPPSIQALSIANSPDKYPHLALPFAVIRANYAHHCWAAVQTLRERFPRSPYATAVLPTIKSLGPISYVLGASTELYNELLFLRWVHYKDLQACADLLAEMLSRGIPTSVWTRAVFRDAAQRWLRARKQLKAEGSNGARDPAPGDSEEDAALHSDGSDSSLVRPFEVAWWSLEGVQSGFKRWETLEVEARRRNLEERERRNRLQREAEEDENDGEDSDEKSALAQPSVSA